MCSGGIPITWATRGGLSLERAVVTIVPPSVDSAGGPGGSAPATTTPPSASARAMRRRYCTRGLRDPRPPPPPPAQTLARGRLLGNGPSRALLRDEHTARALAHHLSGLLRFAERPRAERAAEPLGCAAEHRRLGRHRLARERGEGRQRLADPGDGRAPVAAVARGERLADERLHPREPRGRLGAQHDPELAHPRKERLERLGEVDQVRVRARSLVGHGALEASRAAGGAQPRTTRARSRACSS